MELTMTKKQEDRVTKLADAYESVRVEPLEDGKIAATGGRWADEDTFVGQSSRVTISDTGDILLVELREDRERACLRGVVA